MIRTRSIVFVFSVALSFALVAPLFAQAQLSPAMDVPPLAQARVFALSHPFALPGATTTRLAGMGGFVTCIPDVGFANPAFCGTLTQSHVLVRESVTSFQSGLRLKGDQGSIAVPLKENKSGFQVTAFHLQTTSAFPAWASGFSTTENDLSIHYGQRASKRLALGLGVSPVFHNSTDVALLLNSVRPSSAAPNLQSSSDSGFRLGALYQVGKDAWLGGVFDRYTEDVAATWLMPVRYNPITSSWKSRELAFGLSGRLTDQLIGAIEWQQVWTGVEGMRFGDSGWRVGIEGNLNGDWKLRVGTNDGALSLGTGIVRPNWSLNYAYIRNWNEGLIGSELGSSNTHQLELTHSF